MVDIRREKTIFTDLYVGDEDTPIETQISNQITSEVDNGIDWTDAEQDTGKTFLGDTVFQKTIEITGTLTGGSANDTPHGITGLAKIVSLYGGMEDGDASNKYPLPLASGSANVGVQVQIDNGNVQITPGSFWNRADNTSSLENAHVTILYTKTA